MNELLKILLSLSISGTLLILLLFLFKPLFKKKISKQWQYYIWLIVIARLLFPFAPEINLVGNLFQAIDNSVLQTENIMPSEQNSFNLDESNFSNNYTTMKQISIESNQWEKSVIKQVQRILTLLIQNIWLIWLVVALMLLTRKITIYQSFAKYIRAGRIEVSDIEVLEQFGEIMEKAGVKKVIRFYTNSLISSPLLIGFFSPSIVLPSIELSHSDFQYTILHELMHYKRGDMFYKWLVEITICLHWFNPLIYLMGSEIRRACELSCDEAVIMNLDYSQKRAYGDNLLNAMGVLGGNYKNFLASVTLNDSKELLKERLDAIMSYKKKSKTMIATTLAITLVLFCGATYTGAYAASDGNLATHKSIPLKSVETSTENTKMKTATIFSKVYYLVENEQQLKSIGSGQYTLDLNYMLNKDITLTEEWNAIGDFDHPFTGTFDGNGFVINNLKNTNKNAVFIGLFGYTENARIHNVTLRNVDISHAGGKGKHVGAIVAVSVNSEITDNQIIK